MTSEEAVRQFEGCFKKDTSGRYVFACRKAILILKLAGVPGPLRFFPVDQVGFRIAAREFTVEELVTGAVRHRFSWEQVIRLNAGEPETDSGALFQG